MQSNTNKETVPEGYAKDAMGRLVPVSMVPEYIRQRDALVLELVDKFTAENQRLKDLKQRALEDVAAHVQLVAEKYGAKVGGDKGNVQLVSYDGLRKLTRVRAARVVVTEGIQAAEQLITDLLAEWTEDAKQELRVLVDRAFRRNKAGEISVSRMLDLVSVEIEDERWIQATNAIREALQAEGSVTYIRAYQRDRTDRPWRAIPLDIAAILVD